MGLFKKLFRKETNQTAEKTDILMTSQLAALYIDRNDEKYRKRYIDELVAAGVPRKHAKAMFEFDCSVIRKYDKKYLLNPSFTAYWFFGLQQPFFREYPKAKKDILKERFLTMSEICKIIDEAEWHYWNSHERNMPDDVWSEIYSWRLKGSGMAFAIQYFGMISEVTHMPIESIAKISNLQGAHLSKYKWR